MNKISYKIKMSYNEDVLKDESIKIFLPRVIKLDTLTTENKKDINLKKNHTGNVSGDFHRTFAPLSTLLTILGFDDESRWR